MINKVKGAVKTALMQKKIEEYYAGLDARFVSYDEWITEHEEGTCTELDIRDVNSQESTYSVSIVEYSSCDASFDWKKVCKPTDTTKDNHIFLFVNNKENLASNAVSIIREYFAAHPECVLVYGDEDEWNSNRSIRMNPWFKPDFSPDTLLAYFYYGNVFAVRASELEGISWKAEENCLMNLYDMCLQISFPVKREKIGHVQYVLYHAESLKALCAEDVYIELKEKYSANCKGMELIHDESRKDFRSLNIPLENKDKITIVIPSKDHPEVLGVCLESLIITGKNENYEIVVVDNGSNEDARREYEKLKVKYGFDYIFEPMEFNFSCMCNMGAKAATGSYLLFLNDDIEAKEEGWMSKMLMQASKTHVGAVGAKLYYPESKMIQHAGITNLRLGPVHKMQFLEDSRSYYDGRNVYDSNVLAVTAACLMVRREVFEACGGFSEELAVAFNDVELGFRLYKMGYYNVQCNSAVLYHHESLSRGNDETVEKQVRLQKERRKLYAMHSDLYGYDPFYHPYMNNQILDTNFSFAYEYPSGEEIDVCEPKLLKGGLRPEWYNDCLLISFEYADDLTAWLEGPDKSGKELYFQGYQFVIGSDNAGFRRSVLLKNVDKEEIWEVSCGEHFRPDLDVNVPEGHVSLCGFACVIEKNQLPAGKYQVGCMAVSQVDRLRLCRFVNKYVSV